MRNILHCDMNNFYASVECMLDPTLKKYPIAVCGSVEERHGIVLAKNYKAKAFDVKTGDAVWQAKQKCKDLRKLTLATDTPNKRLDGIVAEPPLVYDAKEKSR